MKKNKIIFFKKYFLETNFINIILFFLLFCYIYKKTTTLVMEQDCTKNCITCGKQFNPGSRHKQVINCSRECYKIYATTIRKKPEKKIFLKECATCKKQFNPGRHKETLNCSPECRKIYALE